MFLYMLCILYILMYFSIFCFMWVDFGVFYVCYRMLWMLVYSGFYVGVFWCILVYFIVF